LKTLGEFYKEKILSCTDLIPVQLPNGNGENRVEKDLFGWKLYAGKDCIECRSGEAARYLKILLDAGMTEVSVPKDEDYLKSILPELERLKKKIDEIVDSYLDSVLDRRVRERVRSEVFMELTK
jgi:hypothetical protein